MEDNVIAMRTMTWCLEKIITKGCGYKNLVMAHFYTFHSLKAEFHFVAYLYEKLEKELRQLANSNKGYIQHLQHELAEMGSTPNDNMLDYNALEEELQSTQDKVDFLKDSVAQREVQLEVNSVLPTIASFLDIPPFSYCP